MPTIQHLFDRVVPPGICEGCPNPARLRVGGRGNSEARLVAVGEQPGDEEFKHGKPFVGPSGILFTQILPQGFNQDAQLLVLNAMQCRVRKTGNQGKDQQEKYRCTVICWDRLHRQLWEHERDVILAMGNWAVLGVTGLECKITQRRGEVLEMEDPTRPGKIVKVVHALHPAYLLRGGGSLKQFRADVLTAIELAYGTAVAYPGDTAPVREEWQDPEFDVIETPADIRALADWVEAQDRVVYIALDYETASLNPFDKEWGYILSSGIYGDWDNNVAQIFPWRAMADSEFAVQYRRLRTLPNVRWIFQGGKFDYKFECMDKLLALPPEELSIHEDTLMCSYALNESSNEHDLDVQSKNWLGAPDHKDMLRPYLPKKDTSYAFVPAPVLYDYQARDLKKTYKLWCKTRAAVQSDPHLEKLYTRTLIPSQTVFADIERWGITVDWDYVRIAKQGPTQEDIDRGLVKPINVDRKGNLLGPKPEYEKGLDVEIQEILAEAQLMAGWPVNLNAPQQVMQWLYVQEGLRLNGKVPDSTDKDILDKVWEQTGNTGCRLVIKYRRLTKMKSTYVGAIEKFAVDGIVHTTYKLHRTKTGRPSSAEPNVLNIPREARFRRMYRARNGYVLLEGDYNTAELRMLAVLSGDHFLVEVFLDDRRNLHDEVAVAMYGPDWTQDQRIRAKAVNFGIPYGRSAFTLAFEFNMSVQEAQRLIDAWFERAPQAHDFIMRNRLAAIEGKSLITVFGRKRRPGVVSRDRIHGLQNEFANFPMQSPVADFTFHSAREMLPHLRKMRGHVINPVYDSNLVEVPADPVIIQEASCLLKETMEAVPKRYIRTPILFKTDLKLGRHWGMLREPKGGLAGIDVLAREVCASEI